MIRPAREEDVARCAQLAQTHELANHDDTYVSERFLRSYIDDDELFFVLEEEGEVIGFALAQPFKGAVLELIFLVIAEEHRGKGKGKGLLEHMRTRGEQLKKGSRPLGKDRCSSHAQLLPKGRTRRRETTHLVCQSSQRVRFFPKKTLF
jgi:ribosomal protein S18 acetylase RimI-like enzyme